MSGRSINDPYAVWTEFLRTTAEVTGQSLLQEQQSKSSRFGTSQTENKTIAQPQGVA